MKNKLILLAFCLILGGCYKTEFGVYEPDIPSSDKGTLDIQVVNPDGIQAASGGYAVFIDGQEHTIPDGGLNLTQTIDTGTYFVHLYNKPEEYNFTTTSNPDSVIASLPVADGEVASNPDDIYYGNQTIIVAPDKTTTIEIKPSRITRPLILDLEIEGERLPSVKSVAVSLSGIASGWDCVSNKPYGDAASISIPIDDFSEGSISRTLNLLGIVPNKDQILTANIEYSDGGLMSSIPIDLSDQFAEFNNDKSKPCQVAATIVIPDAEAQSELELTVNDANISVNSFNDYLIMAGNEKIEVSDKGLVTTQTVNTGASKLHVVNTPSDYNFATGFAPDKVIVTLPVSEGFVSANPTNLYYYTEDIVVYPYKTTSVTADPLPMTRELNFDLEFDGDSKDGVESVTISLSGVASGWDCVADKPYGDAVSVTIPVCEYESYKISEVFNLLGVEPTADQVLTIGVKFKGNNPAPATITSDLSSKFADFNSDKSKPLTISATVTLPSESNIGGSIGDWNVSIEDDVNLK